MSFYNKICTQVISLLCLIDVLTHAADNVTLVNKMCGATSAPVVCTSCIKSNNKDALTDVDVIHQMLGCLQNDALKLMDEMDKFINNNNSNSADSSAIGILKKHKANSYPPVMVTGVHIAQEEVSMRKFNDAKTTIRERVYRCLMRVMRPLDLITPNRPSFMFSGILNVEKDYKISDQLLASVKA